MLPPIQQDNEEKVDEKEKETSSVNLIELVSICYDLAGQSGIKIAEILASGNLHVHDKYCPNKNNNNNDKQMDAKDEDKKQILPMPAFPAKLKKRTTMLGSAAFEATDPQTLADIVVQQLIEQGIHSIYPDMIVKGEENLDDARQKRKYISDHCIKNIKVSKTLPSKYADLLSNNSNIDIENRNLDIKDIVLWIDPVDGTKCFTLAPKDKKSQQSVTCLIGIVYKSRPIAGIINAPFDNNKTYFAIANVGVFGVYNDKILNETFLKEEIKRDLNRRYIAASMIFDRKPQVVKYLNEQCKAQKIVKMGGAGNKILSIVLSQSDAYVKISPGTKKWDICAPEAFILAIGGALTDKFGNVYMYDKNVSVENINGVIATWTVSNGYHASYCQKLLNT